MKRPTAVIVGMETNGLAVSRALSACQIPCIGLAGPQWTPSCQTNSCQVTHAQSWSSDAVIAELKSIGGRLDQKAPLLITKDEPVLWVSDCREQLSEFYHINLPAKETVDLLMNKTKFLELASTEKWPVPHSWQISDKQQLVAALERITFPSILKPQIKNSEFREHCPSKAFKVYSPDELLRSYEFVAQWESQVIVQEWIEGKDEQIVFCLTYYDGSGNPRAVFPGRKLLQWPLECGNTVISEPLPDSALQTRIVELTKTIWQKVSFRGLGSIEYKVRKHTNEPVIMEPTVGRTNYQNELAVVNGCNIPMLAYCDLAGIEPLSVSRPSRPVKLVDGSAEMSAVMESHRTGKLVIREWLKNRRGKKKYATLRLNDMGPFVASVLQAAKNGLSELLLRVLGPRVKSTLKSAIHGLSRRRSEGRA